MTDSDRRTRLRRRQALAGLAAVGTGSLAGCSSVLGSENEGTVLGRIEVINSSFVRNRIRLIVDRDDGTDSESDDESLLDRTVSLAPLDSTDGERGLIVEPLWDETQANYTVRAVHYGEDGDRESQVWEHTLTAADYERVYGDSDEDPGCIGALVKIGSRDETENGTISVGPTYMEHPCGTPDGR